MSKKRIILAITGASGTILGIRALELLKELGIETHLLASKAAKITNALETERPWKNIAELADITYDPEDITASLASGSFHTDGMLVIPCSIKSLSAIANSYTADLITRAADVCLKEGRPLLLAVRETPFHAGHLALMQQAAAAGAIIYPPIPAFYQQPESIDQMIDQVLGRLLARIGIENNFYQPWADPAESI